MPDPSDATGSPTAPGGAAPASPLAASPFFSRWSLFLTWVARPALLLYWPFLFYLTHSTESPKVNAILHEFQNVHPDKWAHVISFTLLTVLLVFAALAGRKASFITNLTVGCLLAGLYGFVDELTQGSFGRTVSGADMTADFWAVSAVYLTLLFLHPERRLLPWSVLMARVLFALIIPWSGVMLFDKDLGQAVSGVKIWKIVPAWMGYIRGDYVAHFLASTLCTLLILAVAPLGVNRRRPNAFFTFGFMLFTGPAIEWVQGHYFKRGAEWNDVHAHSWGVFAAAVIWAAYEFGNVLVRKMLGLPPRAEQAAMRAAGAVPDDGTHESHRFVGHAIVVGLMTLVSRFTGLVRDSVLAAALGLSATADAFSIGFLVPNLFRRLFGEGALTAAFIPIYTDLVRRDRLTAQRLASLCIAAMLVFLGGLTLVGELVLLALVNAREWTPDTSLALRLTMIMLPYMPMICIVALVGGILQVHGKFGAPAAAPIFLNVVMIAGTLAAVEVSGGVETEIKTTYAVTIVSWTVLLAGLVQLLWQIGMVLRYEKFTTTFAGAGPAFRQMLKMMVPMFIGLGVFQINTLCDYLIAFTLSQKTGGPDTMTFLGMTLSLPLQSGDVAALTWAQRLYQFPLGVFGIAVATAIFPALARAAAGMKGTGDRGQGTGEQRHEGISQSDIRNQTSEISSDFQTILHQGLRLTFFIGLPASAGLILLRIPITRLIYERGEFSLADSQRVAMIMVGYASVIWAYSMTHVLTRAFYAMKDSSAPLRISIWMVTLNFVLNLLLIWPLGAAGLAWASATSAAMQVVLMTYALRKYVPVPVSADVLKGWKMTAMLTGLMTAVLLPVTLIYDASQMTRTQSAIQLAILLPVGAGIVLIGAWLLKAEELKWLKRRRKKLETGRE